MTLTLTAIQDHLGAWIPQVQGKYINEDWEPVTQGYGAQCWDLAAHWSKSLGLPVINTGGAGRWPGWAGNMVDAFPQSAAIDAAYELIGPDQPGLPGDICVWGDSYYWYPKTHVAPLVRDPRNGWLTCMSQNSTPSVGSNPYPNWSTGPTTLQTLPKAGLIGFIRPRTGGSIAPAGDITPTQEEADMALTEDDRQMMYNFLDGYFKDIKRFPGERTFVQHEQRKLDDTALIVREIAKLPQTILFDTRVDGRNLFDWDKYNAALEIADTNTDNGASVDTNALADALAARLPETDTKALLDALAVRLAA